MGTPTRGQFVSQKLNSGDVDKLISIISEFHDNLQPIADTGVTGSWRTHAFVTSFLMRVMGNLEKINSWQELWESDDPVLRVWCETGYFGIERRAIEADDIDLPT